MKDNYNKRVFLTFTHAIPRVIRVVCNSHNGPYKTYFNSQHSNGTIELDRIKPVPCHTGELGLLLHLAPNLACPLWLCFTQATSTSLPSLANSVGFMISTLHLLLTSRTRRQGSPVRPVYSSYFTKNFLKASSTTQEIHPSFCKTDSRCAIYKGMYLLPSHKK